MTLYFHSNQNSFFVKHVSFIFFSCQSNFFIKHTKFEKRKELKKQLDKKLMSVAWHLKRWWHWRISEDEKMEIDSMFIKEL